MFGQLMQKHMQALHTQLTLPSFFFGKSGTPSIHTKHTNKLHTQPVCLDPTQQPPGNEKKTQQQPHFCVKKTIQKKPCLRMCCIKGERYQIQSIIGRGIQQNIRRLKESNFFCDRRAQGGGL